MEDGGGVSAQVAAERRYFYNRGLFGGALLGAIVTLALCLAGFHIYLYGINNPFGG